MTYIPKSLEEQAYNIGREHGSVRGRNAVLTKVRTAIHIPPEFEGHANAVALYLQGQDDGYFVVLERAAAKEAEQRRVEVEEMCQAAGQEMDRLEAGDAARSLPPGVGAVAMVVSLGGTLLYLGASIALACCLGCAGVERDRNPNDDVPATKTKGPPLLEGDFQTEEGAWLLSNPKAGEDLRKTFNGW